MLAFSRLLAAAGSSGLMARQIGADLQAWSTRLDALSASATAMVRPTATVGVEASNAVPVVIQLKDSAGVNVARVQRLRLGLADSSLSGLASVAAQLSKTGGGVGTVVSTAAKSSILVDTDANGVFSLTVTDVTAVLVGTMYLQIWPQNAPGVSEVVPIVFA